MAFVCGVALVASQTALVDMPGATRGGVPPTRRRSHDLTEFAPGSDYVVIGVMSYYAFAARSVLATATVVGATHAHEVLKADDVYAQSFSLFGAVGALGSLTGAPLVRWIGARTTFVIFLLACIACPTVMIVGKSAMCLRFSFCALGFSVGGDLSVTQLILNSQVANDRLGGANGIIDASGMLARALVPLLVAKFDGYAWYISCLLPTLSLPLLLFLPDEKAPAILSQEGPALRDARLKQEVQGDERLELLRYAGGAVEADDGPVFQAAVAA